ncbi:MAG TPA: hypothetical protein VKF39_02735 [Nitrososphaerales archaeon]|nr:hypothetical protein [Nitrososphaerales archaeon]
MKAGAPELVRGGPSVPFALTVWLVGCVALSAAYALQSFYPAWIGPLSNLFSATCAAIALGSAIQCINRYGFTLRTRFQAAWISFAVGFALWTAAETIWATYYFVLGVPIPNYSLADVFYSSGYLPIFAGMVLYLDTFSVALEKKRVAAAVAVMVVAAAAVYFTVVPTEAAAGRTFLETLDNMTFILLDLAFLALVVLTFTIFVGGRISKWLAFVGVGAVLYVVGDEDFLIQTANGTYYNGSYNDLIFLLAYLTFALAFYLHRKEW